ncbi:MAG TPA: hypothetical protein VNP04_23955 [Alphaproteobacteria bacterium]|nr:hypothetical protein [Alphaproteobacteria bacterium]
MSRSPASGGPEAPAASTQWLRSAFRPQRVLFLVGFLSLALYVLLFTIPLFMPRYVSHDIAVPVLPGELVVLLLRPPPGYTGPPLALLELGLGALALLYFLGLRPWLRGDAPEPPSHRTIFAFSALFCAVLILSYPLMSTDIFRYAFDGKVWTVYGENPFITSPTTFPEDPFLPWVSWKDRPAAYGPLWRWIEGASALPFPHDLTGTVLVLKGWTTLFFLADVVLVYAILRRRAPQWAPVGALLFGWNPLLVLEAAANGHNDSVVAFFLLLSVYCWETKRPLLVMPALVLSALVKPVTLLLAPLYVLYLARSAKGPGEALRLFVGSGLLCGALIVGAYLPFWGGLKTFQGLLLESSLFSAGTLAHSLYELMKALGAHAETARAVVRAVSVVLFGAIYLVELAQMRQREERDFVASSMNLLFWYLLIANMRFLPWHLFWLMAFAPLLPPSSPQAFIGVLFTVLALVSYPLHTGLFPMMLFVFGPMTYMAYRYRAILFQRRPSESLTPASL